MHQCIYMILYLSFVNVYECICTCVCIATTSWLPIIANQIKLEGPESGATLFETQITAYFQCMNTYLFKFSTCIFIFIHVSMHLNFYNLKQDHDLSYAEVKSRQIVLTLIRVLRSALNWISTVYNGSTSSFSSRIGLAPNIQRPNGVLKQSTPSEMNLHMGLRSL